MASPVLSGAVSLYRYPTVSEETLGKGCKCRVGDWPQLLLTWRCSRLATWLEPSLTALQIFKSTAYIILPFPNTVSESSSFILAYFTCRKLNVNHLFILTPWGRQK